MQWDDKQRTASRVGAVLTWEEGRGTGALMHTLHSTMCTLWTPYAVMCSMVTRMTHTRHTKWPAWISCWQRTTSTIRSQPSVAVLLITLHKHYSHPATATSECMFLTNHNEVELDFELGFTMY